LATSAGITFAEIGSTYTINSIGYIGFTILLGKYVTAVGIQKKMEILIIIFNRKIKSNDHCIA